MENILVSACIFGDNCKYNGGNNYEPLIEKIKRKYNIILCCPECMGGLPTPRIPSERLNGRVINKEGKDVTIEFTKGCAKTLELVKKYNITKAILKDGSPSCGSTYIYDGTFTGTKISGNGVTADILRLYNVEIYTENDLKKLI